MTLLNIFAIALITEVTDTGAIMCLLLLHAFWRLCVATNLQMHVYKQIENTIKKERQAKRNKNKNKAHKDRKILDVLQKTCKQAYSLIHRQICTNENKTSYQ